MITAMARITERSTPKEADDRRNAIIELRQYVNQGLYSLGEQLEVGATKEDWKALGYESIEEWYSDPEGIALRPRTARFYRACFLGWRKLYLALGLTEEEIKRIDHTKIKHVVRAIDSGKSKEEILEAIHETKMLTWRELHEVEEGEKWIIFKGDGEPTQILDEKGKFHVEISRWTPTPFASAQNIWDIIGNKIVEITIRIRK